MTTPDSITSVMVVDDTIENLRLLSSILSEQGFEVRPVTSGRQALQAAERDPPDLVLLDINMPEMNGYETCAALKRLERLDTVPIIFLTAINSTEDKVRAFNAGGVDYVTKPFQVEEVLARVKTHVALRRARMELVHSYERLRALERLRDNLVHMVVHDMRSPLMALASHLGMLEDEQRSLTSEASLAVEGSLHAVEVLRRMANDVLDVNRMEAGALPLACMPCDLVAIARDVCGVLAAVDRRRALELVSSAPVLASCDARLVYRVIENLVGNAIKHTPAGGEIRVSVAPVRGRVRVEVADEGPGVPHGDRERIFDKFGTLEARQENAYHSAGLGLAFCKLAVDAHRGSIGVSDGARTGSVFWFELPA